MPSTSAFSIRLLKNVAGLASREYRFPPALPQPITFKSIFVIDRVGPGPAVQSAGAVSLRDVRVLLAGSGEAAQIAPV